MIIDMIHRTFFHSDDFLHWTHRPDQILYFTFMLALFIEFKLALNIHNKGYTTDKLWFTPVNLRNYSHLHGYFNIQSLFQPHGTYCTYLPNHPDRKGSGIPILKHIFKCLNFDDIPPPIMEYMDMDRTSRYYKIIGNNLRNLQSLLTPLYFN